MADTKLSPWKAGLRNASFRGVQFHVVDRDFESGRRIHNHEYPKRNSNFPEDMGKSTREFSVEAYVIGDDYMNRRNRLVAACEQEGPGSYVDHWGITQKVVCTKIKLGESSEEGRMCRFRLDFIEAGSGNFAPVAIAATAAQLTTAAGALAAAATQSLNARTSR